MTRSFLWTGVRLAALCSLLLLAACGGKQIPPRDGIPSPHLGTIRDMRSFPQDLTVFAQQAGADTPLLDSQAHRAKIILSKQGELLDYRQYRKLMAE